MWDEIKDNIVMQVDIYKIIIIKLYIALLFTFFSLAIFNQSQKNLFKFTKIKNFNFLALVLFLAICFFLGIY